MSPKPHSLSLSQACQFQPPPSLSLSCSLSLCILYIIKDGKLYVMRIYQEKSCIFSGSVFLFFPVLITAFDWILLSLGVFIFMILIRKSMAFESQSLKKEKKYSGVFGDVYSMAILPKELELEKEPHPKFKLRFQLPDLTQPIRVSPPIFCFFYYHFEGKVFVLFFFHYWSVWLLIKWA